MRISLAVALTCASVAAGSLTAAQTQQTPPPATGTAVVAGQVTDATTGRPVGGATVVLANGSPLGVSTSGAQMAPRPQNRLAVAVANGQGRFVFRDVPAGDYWLSAQLEGYAPGASGRKRIGGPSRSFPVGDGARMTDAVIPMWRFGAISGSVRDDRGEPVVGVGVWAMRRTLIGGRQELTFTGGTVEATDDRGHYRLSNLTPGSYVVVVRTSTQSAPIAAVDAYQAAVTSGTAGPIARAWSESGALRISSTGLVIDNWQVSVSNSEPPPLPGPNGTLLVHPPVFHASAASAAQATIVSLNAGDDRTGIDISLPLVTGVRVSGTITGPDGPAVNSGVRLVPASGETLYETPSAYGMTDAAGRFALFGIPPGSYTVRAYRVPPTAAPGRPGGVAAMPLPPAAGALPTPNFERVTPGPPGPSLFAEAAVSVGATHVDGVSLALRPGAKLSGQIVFEGATPPPSGPMLERAQLAIRPLNGSGPNIDVRVDAQGKLTTSGIAPGRYTLNVTAMPGTGWSLASAHIGGVDAAQQAFTIGTTDVEGAVLTFTDKTITLMGTVRSANGIADPDTTVVVFPADSQSWLSDGMSPRRVAIVPPSASGAYDVKIAVAGDYLVVAVPPDITPEVDADFIKQFSGAAVRVTLALGDTKTLALITARAR